MTNYNKMVREPFAEDPTPKVSHSPIIREPFVKATEDLEESMPKEGTQIATVLQPNHLNVRQLPDIQSPVVVIALPDDKLIVKSISDDWAHVYTSAGIEGYVISQYIVLPQVE
jgi:hypothetical protein